jgi:DNA-binding response OmpR family regulator
MGGYNMKEKLLIVEDDEAIASIVKEHLEKEGYEVLWSSSGKEGLEDFKKGKFNLVMVDIMLPEMDGFTLCKNIRWVDEEVPIIIISAKQNEVDKVKGLKLGADDYITKPFSLMELAARVEAQLRRHRKSEGSIFQSERLEFNNGLSIIPEESTVLIHNSEVALTSKEYELLYLMAQNPNKNFSKEELYEHIWESVEVEGNNTVTVHIKALREKIKDSIKNPVFIQTVWGVGYKFIGEQKL